MKIHKLAPDEDWIGYALSHNGQFIIGAGVSYEHWDVKGCPRLFYFGLSTSGGRRIAIIGWFIFILPAVPLVLQEDN